MLYLGQQPSTLNFFPASILEFGGQWRGCTSWSFWTTRRHFGALIDL